MYSQEVADRVCERVAQGMSLRKACEPDGVSHSTVLEWARNDTNGFANQYTRARELNIYARQDQLQEIVESATPEDVAVVRLRFDHARWDFSKVLPKVFGEKTSVEHSGEVTQTNLTYEDAKRIAQERSTQNQ